MRSGKILVEDCPRRLMSIHNLPNLEEVFLQLCIEDENHNTNTIESVNVHKKIRVYSRSCHWLQSSHFLGIGPSFSESKKWGKVKCWLAEEKGE